MSGEYKARKVVEKSSASISLFLSKATRGLPGLMSKCHGQIGINSSYPFTTNAL